MTDVSTTGAPGPSRRQVAAAAAWSAPVAVAAFGAPSAQASTAPADPFDGLTGLWGTPHDLGGVTRVDFTVVNTATTGLLFNGITLNHSNIDGADQQTLAMGAVGWRSSNDIVDLGTAASPPIRISSWRIGTAPLEPGGAVVFGVFVARSGSVALLPSVSELWNSGVVPASSFPSLTLRTW
ncbi:hypothetical protein C5C27_16950 [Rathayibacter sp. AY2B7]|uniref:hypothetical protein n=1 Tax=Rathayibacter sp. AY2B7 TaxID=2080571 RepID=UPI000CE8149C|nr:hypothetical protein [Rathayibacter sp. AY2B7]PPG50286.1 hypothetical protein C5C27_16950 [Rathayibacter sp. AY2B7]